jgi:anti-anti-sigma regulatory factor
MADFVWQDPTARPVSLRQAGSRVHPRGNDDAMARPSRRAGLLSSPAHEKPVVRSLADAVPLVVADGELTGADAVRLRRTVGAQLSTDPRLVVIDVRAVRALPHDGVAALVDIAYEAGERTVGLCLVCGRSDRHPVLVALREAGVFELFEVQPDRVAALGTLR